MPLDRRQFAARSRFRKALRDSEVRDGARIVVAVSGGADSVALLDLARRESVGRGWKLRVGHLDHGLHPGSAAHARFVRDLSRRFGIPSTGLRVRPSAWERRRGDSIEAAARDFRRRALRRIARRHGAETILLGHTREDQVETVLLHLLAGAGVDGLGGMEGRRGGWVRPLLGVARADLRHWLEREALAWCEDPTNEDLRYLRNRIRQRLIPLLENEIRPGTVGVLDRTADVLRRHRAWVRSAIDRAWPTVSPTRDGRAIRLDRPTLAAYDPVLVEGVLRRAFREIAPGRRGLGQAHVRALERAVRETVPRRFDLPSGIQVTVNAREVRLVERRNGPRSAETRSRG